MSDYIEREAAIEAVKSLYPAIPLVKLNIDKWHEKNKAYMECETAIEHIPAADVRHVMRGFNVIKDYPSLFECSVCGWSDDDTTTGDTRTYNYCPNCGADMREVLGDE